MQNVLDIFRHLISHFLFLESFVFLEVFLPYYEYLVEIIGDFLLIHSLLNYYEDRDILK